MLRIRQALNSRYFIWAFLSIPSIPILIGLLTGYADGALVETAEEIRGFAGQIAALLMVVALLLTPLLQLRRLSFLRWLMQRRRCLGVAAFSYAAVHVALYVLALDSLGEGIADLGTAEIVLGWVAFFVFIPLAATSNQVSARLLGRRWKQVQRLTYLAAVVVLVHWVLVEHGPAPAVIFFGPLAALELFRVWRARYGVRPTGQPDGAGAG